jgi:hypothetical protein
MNSGLNNFAMERYQFVIPLFTLIIIILLTGNAHAKRLHKEKEYQECWCSEAGGITEFVLSDRTRVDCLTNEYAIEFDFADKWAEAIGQSLYYAEMTGKKPGIVLITERVNDERYLKRLEFVAGIYNIKIWVMTAEGL